jgi:hypothetical protein
MDTRRSGDAAAVALAESAALAVSSDWDFSCTLQAPRSAAIIADAPTSET